MIVYLHGFDSGGTSAKATWLRRELAPIPLYAPTYPATRLEDALAQLRADLETAAAGRRLLLIGSSLGGAYAQCLAPEFSAGLVLINPALRPDETLRPHVGRRHNPATGEDYDFTTAQAEALARLRPVRCDPALPTLVLLDAGDEVLDHRVARDFYRGCGETLVFDAGSHAFDHLPEAKAAILALYGRLRE